MSARSVAPPSSAFLARFRARAAGDDALSFADFMDLALYDATVGYYRADRERVGYGTETDFFTATTSGPLFGELICAACATLLPGENLGDYTFVEIGAEPAGGVLAGVNHPFGAHHVIRLVEPLAISGRCVVFSNELFDAQPCRRFVARDGAWREIFVQLTLDASLAEIERPLASAAPSWLPPPPADDYHFDAPRAATELAARIASLDWTGLFLACDYGKTLAELAAHTPAGTCRAYFRHTQSNDLLARPGEQDLTCHVCWDWLADELAARDFSVPVVESQEAFFVHHAADFLAQLTAREHSSGSPRKRALLQLLHPAHLGQKFQTLHARRL